MTPNNSQTKFFKIYLKALALIYSFGALLHLADLFDLRLKFSNMTNAWKFWILLLLICDLIAAVGLFRSKLFGEMTFLFVACLQIFAYGFYTSFFGNQNLLIVFHFICILIYIPLKVNLFAKDT